MRHERQYRGDKASRLAGHKQREVTMGEGSARLFVGIDWGTEEHQVCVEDASGAVTEKRRILHSGDGLAGMCDWLLELAGGDSSTVSVAIEVPHGPVVETLLERGFVVFSINPKQLDRFRDRFSMAGAKDDRLDAYVLSDSLRTDEHCFRKVKLDEPEIIELREFSRISGELTTQRNRLSNKIREQLRRYYPQALELPADVDATWFLDLLMLASTPEKARRIRESSVGKILRKRRVRKVDAKNVLQTLRKPGYTVAPGTPEAASSHVRLLVQQLRLVNEQLKDCRRQLAVMLDAFHASTVDTLAEESDEVEKCEQRSDVEILRSLPGIGVVVLATLLAEASQPLGDRAYHTLRALSGAGPVTRRTGKRRPMVMMRRACNPRLREALYHWARVSVQHDPVSREHYARLRAKGHSYGRALRGIGDRLLNVACAMLRNRTLYDPSMRHRTAQKEAA